MHLSTAEAIQRIDEAVIVEMLVRRAKSCSGSRQIFLDSETSYRDPNNLGIIISESAGEKLRTAGIVDPAAHFDGKTIRVRGVVLRKDKGPSIDVSEVDQIEVVDDKSLT